MDSLKKQQTLATVNLLSVILAIFVNYYSQVNKINGNTIGELSGVYTNLFTPAGYAFAIWGIIYLAIILFCSFQIYQSFIAKRYIEFIVKSSYWFTLANIANAAWIFAWLYEYTLLSVFIMLIILFSLLKVILNTNMERSDAPKQVISFLWWPIGIYSGWITVATIANIAAYLAKINWNGAIFSEVQWTIIMIVVATIVNVLMIAKRKMQEFALVGVWALLAISVRQQNNYEVIAFSALTGAIILFFYGLYHRFKNRKTEASN
jgi:hypothetical protein